MAVEHHQRRVRSEILTARQGLLAGLVGGVALAVVASGLSLAAGRGLWMPVNAAASFWLGLRPVPAGWAGFGSLLGVAVILLTAGLLGVLYASAQEPVDTPSLLLIAVYYGFSTWFVANFLLLSWLNPAVRAVWQSWPVLLGHLVYGATLGIRAAARNPWHKPKT